jgi:hypothetical protein
MAKLYVVAEDDRHLLSQVSEGRVFDEAKYQKAAEEAAAMNAQRAPHRPRLGVYQVIAYLIVLSSRKVS